MRREVTFVSPVQYPSSVGLSYRIRGLTDALERARITCRVICPSDRSAPSRVLLDRTRIESVSIPHKFISREYPFVMRLLGIVLFWIKAIPKLTRSILNGNTIVFEQVFTFPLMLLRFLSTGKKCIVDDMILMHPTTDSAAKWLYLALDLLTLKISSKVMTASPLTMKFVDGQRPSASLLFLPNGCIHVDREPGVLSPARRQNIKAILVGALSFNQNRVAALNVIEFAKYHGSETNSLRIAIVGGPLREAASLRCIAGNASIPVILTGPISDESLRQEYLESSIGLLPFFEDTPLLGGSRTKALEYFAYGLLVISGTQGIGGLPGIRPMVHYVSTVNKGNFAEALIDVHNHPEKYESIRLAGFEYIRTEYNWDKIAKKLIDFIS